MPTSERILVLADYLQLFTNPVDEKKMSREERVEATCNALASICKPEGENLALVLLSQFSRPEKDRKDPRPKVTDLKGSAAIEACAILILLLFRPDMHGIFSDTKGTNLRGLCEINIAKGRYVDLKPVYAKFIGKYSKFEDYKPDDNGIVSSGEEAF